MNKALKTNPRTLHLTVLSLTRAEPVCRMLKEVVVEPSTEELDWSPVTASEDWTLWSKLALKLGETTESEASFLLSALSAMCAAVHRRNSAGVSMILDMAFSHSQFLNVMLAKTSSTKSMLKIG